MENDSPFGGQTIVLGGDFRQVLSVVLYASRASTVQNSVKYLQLWPLFGISNLSKNMRAKPEELDFANVLFQIGTGEYPSAVIENTQAVHLPRSIMPRMIFKNNNLSAKKEISIVYSYL